MVETLYNRSLITLLVRLCRKKEDRMTSVIIPVYNEERMLVRHGTYFQTLAQAAELIFVDGGSVDKTVTLASRLGRVIKARKNRAAQMNAGARAAVGDILLFLHADSIIPSARLEEITQAVEKRQLAGGCLTQVLDDPGLLFRWIAFTGNVRAKGFKIFYGDQGIFVRRAIFENLSGFPEVSIGEDVLFSKRLRKAGKTDILPLPILCSARRWKKQGVFRTFLMNARITTALALGHHPDRFASQYLDVRQ